MISLIAAIGKNNELGQDGKLIFQIKEDMQFFRETTTSHPVLMGRKTYESIGRPLPNRTNFVITRHPELLPKGVTGVNDLRKFLEEYKDSEEELFVIGGAMVYYEALPYAKCLYLTEIDASSPADTFFPTYDKSKYTKTTIKKGRADDLVYEINKYVLK